jgi:predicted AlkP superfamily pyrophosphatase or phosphodiesterase
MRQTNMSYQVLYWDMPICQRQCVIDEPPQLNKIISRSLSCGRSSILSENDDAVWPGLFRATIGGKNVAFPDIIVEHQLHKQGDSGDDDNDDDDDDDDEQQLNVTNDNISIPDSGLSSSCCSDDGDIDFEGYSSFQEVRILLFAFV